MRKSDLNGNPATPDKAECQLLRLPVDPWRLRLECVRGTTGFDGLERISTQTLMDLLEVPQRERTAGGYRHLAALMAELGWTAVRVRDLNRGGYREQVRGYVRDKRLIVKMVTRTRWTDEIDTISGGSAMLGTTLMRNPYLVAQCGGVFL